jgi:hypothetical protein
MPKTGEGSPTNELMRHILFGLIVAQYFELAVVPFLSMAFILNAISMQVPYPLVFSIRSLTTSPAAIGLVNVALVVAWLFPVTALPIGACFAGTYLYSLVAGAVSWAKRS